MRLWHIDIIPYLPKSQLIAQWRELNSIFKKQDKHILINYIYDYDKVYLQNYANRVMEELSYLGVKFRQQSIENYTNYFRDIELEKQLFFPKHDDKYKFKEHDNEYLHICFHNLKEKYIRGQKDFSKEIFEKLYNFYLTNAKFNVIIGQRSD